MDAQDQHNQPGPGYHDLPPDQEASADQQPDRVQSKAEQQQQDPPQPQPQWQTNLQYQPYAFGFPPQPQQQQQQPTSGDNQYQNYGMPPHFQHMSYGGYNFPPPPTQHDYPFAPTAPHLQDGSQPPEGQPGQPQHDQGQFQQSAPQDLQQNPTQQFQQVPSRNIQQGQPQQVQHGNHQYGAPPHHPGFPPQQYPYWGPPGPTPSYPPQYFGGPMMQSSSHEITTDPALRTSNNHHGHSDSPTVPPDQPDQQHGTYPMPPMMGGFPYPGPTHPYYNHPAPSMPPAAPPAAAQPTPEPPKPVLSPGPLAAGDHTSPFHDNASGRSKSRTPTSPAEQHRQTRSQATPPAAATLAPAITSAQTTVPTPSSEQTASAEQTAAVRLLHANTIPTVPPAPYGPDATDAFYACSPETARLHQKALEKTPGINVHAVKHTRDCSSCSKGARSGSKRAASKKKQKKKGGCDRLWPCGACIESDKRWGSCQYGLTDDDDDAPRAPNDENDDEQRLGASRRNGESACGFPYGGLDGATLTAATGRPDGPRAQDGGAADVPMTDADGGNVAAPLGTQPGTVESAVAAQPLAGNAPIDPALDAASTPAADLVSVQLPPDVLQQLLGNPQVLAALQGTGYAGGLQALAQQGVAVAAPRTPLGRERPTMAAARVDAAMGQEQRASPSGSQQYSSPQDERTIGSDGPMTLGQLAALKSREAEGEKEG